MTSDLVVSRGDTKVSVDELSIPELRRVLSVWSEENSRHYAWRDGALSAALAFMSDAVSALPGNAKAITEVYDGIAENIEEAYRKKCRPVSDLDEYIRQRGIAETKPEDVIMIGGDDEEGGEPPTTVLG